MKEQELSKEWFSAAEIAGLGLSHLPHSERGINMLAANDRWRESSCARKRAGRGGGWEYHKSLLPQSARFEIARRCEEEAVNHSTRAVADAAKSEIAEIAPDAAMLSARQREVMLARSLLLMRVDQRVVERGRTRSQAIALVIRDISAETADLELRAAIEAACERKTVTAPSRTQFFAWLKARDAFGLTGLAPKIKRKKSDLPDWFDGFLQFYARPTKPTVSNALHDYTLSLADKAVAPSYDQVRRALSKLGPLERVAGREGKLAMRSRLAYVKRDTSDLMPTTVYTADGKTFRAEIAHPVHGRPFTPEITSVLDASTRVCVGVSAALSETSSAVSEALRHACGDFGIPALFYTDRGPGYVSSGMTDPVTGMLARIGTTPLKALPYNSQAKGNVERLNQIYTAFAKRYDTYIGDDMDREAKQLAYKVTRREIKEIGTSRTLPTWTQFLADLRATVDAYNHQPHSALPKIIDAGRKRNMTPMEMWAAKRAEGFEPIVPSQAELDDMSRPYEIRVARRGLVSLNDNSYFLLALEAYDGQRVVVGYDSFDASKVWIRELERTADGERPGRAIGIGIYEGNKTRYVPLTMERKAAEKRAEGRKRRLEHHLDEVQQELDPIRQIDHQPNALSIDIDMETATQPVRRAANDQEIGTARAGYHGRPRFSDEISYVRWLLANPSEVRPRDGENIREYLSLSTFQDNAVSHGIDVAALRALARSVA